MRAGIFILYWTAVGLIPALFLWGLLPRKRKGR